MVNDEQIKQKMTAGPGDGGCSYQMALMVTFRPGVRSWGTNSQWQLLLSSAMSSPGRLASKRTQRKTILDTRTWRHMEEVHNHKQQREEKLINHHQTTEKSFFLVDNRKTTPFG